MKEEQKVFTKNEIFYASKEGKITEQLLVEELRPLIEDYFITIIDQSYEKLTLKFFNGQMFEITAKEINL